jgi:hypothetical protein
VTRIVEFYSLSLVLVLQAVAPRVAAKGAGTPQILDDFLRFVEPRVTADEWDSVLRACVDTLFKLDEGKAADRIVQRMKVPRKHKSSPLGRTLPLSFFPLFFSRVRFVTRPPAALTLAVFAE